MSAHSSSVSQDLDERHGEEPPLVGLRLEVALHPVLVLGLLVEDHDDVALLEGQLVVVVGLAVVQRPAPPEVWRRIVPLLIRDNLISIGRSIEIEEIAKAMNEAFH